MCDPVSIGVSTAALAIGSTVVGAIGQNKAYAANKTASNLNYANEREVIGQQAVEMDKEYSEKAFDTALSTIQSEGSIAASATDQGLSSTAITEALNTSMFGIGRNASIDAVNDRNQRQQLAQQEKGNQIERQANINQKSKAGALSVALGIGQGILQGVNAGKSASKAGA